MNTRAPDFAQSTPTEQLRPYISHYVGFRAYDLQPSEHSGVPSHHLCLAIALAEPIRLLKAPGISTPTTRRSLIVGLSTEPLRVAYGEHRDGLFVHLKPEGVFALLGVRAVELSARTLDFSLVWGNRFTAFMDRLMEASEWRERFAILDQAFVATLKPVHTPTELVWAWNAIARTQGCIPIQRLAAAVGWSRQHLADRFRREFGTSPKTAARIFRFEHAVRLLRARRMGLSQVAAECGFHDQAHLTLEWNAMAGCSPGTWIAKELPFFQYPEFSDMDD